MSMNRCPKCDDIYDTDFQMEEVDGEMVCDRCWEKHEEDQDNRKLAEEVGDMEHILIQDNDSHWYVIPANKTNDWDAWTESKNYEEGVVPNYAKEVGGCPSLVIFKDYRIL